MYNIVLGLDVQHNNLMYVYIVVILIIPIYNTGLSQFKLTKRKSSFKVAKCFLKLGKLQIFT